MIKDFDEYFNKYFNNLEEALNNPLHIDWQLENKIIYGYFSINNKEYKIIAKYIPQNFLTFKFTIKIDNNYSTKIVNDNTTDVYRVLPTVRDGLLFLLNDVKPDGLIFGALDDSIGRKRLYDRFISEYITSNKEYKFYEKQLNNEKIYVIYKNDISNDIVLDAIKYVIDNNLNLTN